MWRIREYLNSQPSVSEVEQVLGTIRLLEDQYSWPVSETEVFLELDPSLPWEKMHRAIQQLISANKICCVYGDLLSYMRSSVKHTS